MEKKQMLGGKQEQTAHQCTPQYHRIVFLADNNKLCLKKNETRQIIWSSFSIKYDIEMIKDAHLAWTVDICGGGDNTG